MQGLFRQFNDQDVLNRYHTVYRKLVLFCLIQVEMPDHTYSAPDDRDNIHVFPTYNFTISIWWSPYLVHVENKQLTWKNSTQAVAFIHVDKLDKSWIDRIPGVDLLQVSTGAHYDSFSSPAFLRPLHCAL